MNLGITTLFAAVATLALQSSAVAAEPSAAVKLDSKILNGFLERYCIQCHGPEKQKGETQLDTLSLAIESSDTALHWQEVLDVLNLGEMPPDDEPAPSPAELKQVLRHLTEALTESKKRFSESGGNTALRRINSREYRNTIDDLFGLQVPAELLPPDDIAEGYDTIGHDQQFSSYHFDEYQLAARSIVEVALKWVDRPRIDSKRYITEPEKRTNEHLEDYIADYDKKMARIRAGATHVELGIDDEKQLQLFVKRYDARAGGRKRYLQRPHADRGLFLSDAGSSSHAVGSPRIQMDPRGSYQLRFAAALAQKTPPIRHFLKCRVGDRTIGYFKVDGSLEKPSRHEMEYRAYLNDDRAGFNVTENRGNTRLKNYLRTMKHKAEWDSSVWVDRLEIEGPTYPRGPSFFETNYQKTLGKPDLENEEEQAKRFLVTFMREAFRRRNPAAEYVDRVFQIYRMNRQNERSIKDSLITPLAMILSSPSFLYIMEDTIGKQSVSETEFANRISYFLWSRPASGDLLRSASQGELTDPDQLRRTVAGMLKHPNSWALADGFFSHWADLKRFDEIAINEADHIGWNNGVRESARLEAQHLFHTMVKENRDLTDLIDSDFTVVNDLLAFHYGLESPDQGSEFAKVSLPADSPRGGFIGATAFLTMGSNGERSSPIIRGSLLMEKFLHREPPPPPPNVPELALASDKPLSVREIVDLHREKAQCASCHSSFDPLGFGLENFDLLGQWRDTETLGNIGKKNSKSRTKQIPIRAEGTFPNTETTFKNLKEFRAGLIAHKHLLTRSITEGLLSYGLGRHLEFADQQTIDQLCEAAAGNNGRIRDLIFEVVNHPIFRQADKPE
jgi:mono/diheme cytochrome c family protein